MKKIAIAFLAALAMVVGLVVVGFSTTASATTDAEKAGCGGYSTTAYANYAVQRSGVSYPQHGNVYIYVKTVNGNKRYCAIGKFDTTTQATIKIGTRQQGDTSNPVTYNSSSDYTDSGTFSSYAGGVALTPSDGRCAAVKLTVTKGGYTYVRFLTYNLCN